MTIKVAIITNIPAPYRIPVYELINQSENIDLYVFYCAEREPNRKWDLPRMNYPHSFLKKNFISIKGNFIHINFDVFKKIKNYSPDIIITTGFNPTHILSFFYAVMYSRTLITMTDGTFKSENRLSFIHRLVRLFFYKKSDAYIYASEGGKELYLSYGINSSKCFKSNLCINNNIFNNSINNKIKKFDFIFSGRVEAIKNPIFALNVAINLSYKIGRKISILFVGDGDQLEEVKALAHKNKSFIDCVFYGFALQNELPDLYHSARILLFPTLWDPWGVVANEACASGLPVMVSTNAGVANELIVENFNGYILNLNLDLWVQKAFILLSEPSIYKEFSKNSLIQAEKYTFNNAAKGILKAIYNSQQIN